jgi:hypothetical protein
MRTVRTLCQYAICALPMLLGLVYIPSLDAPFSAPKNALLIAAAVALFACAAASGWLRAFFRTLVGGVEGKDVRIQLALAFGYCTAVSISWIASPRTDMGAQAVLFALAGPGLFVAAVAVIGGAQGKLILGIALAGAVQGAIALAQWGFGLDLFRPFGGSAGVVGRMQIYGSLGNPDFVAVFIAATMPAAVTLACGVASKKIMRWIWAVLVAGEFVAIFGAGCRTGLFAAIIGTAAVLILRASPSRRELHRRIGIAAVVMLVIGVATVVFARRSPPRMPCAAESSSGRPHFLRATGAHCWAAGRGHSPMAILRASALRTCTRKSRDSHASSDTSAPRSTIFCKPW